MNNQQVQQAEPGPQNQNATAGNQSMIKLLEAVEVRFNWRARFAPAHVDRFVALQRTI